MRKAYQTDLSDAEWSCLEPHLPAPEATARPRLHSPREILDAILYVLKSGCAWRLLPHDFPPWRTVYHYFRAWRLSGIWEKMHAALRERVRVPLKRNPQPSAAIVDRASRSRPRAWAAKNALTTGPRKSKDLKAPPARGHPGIGAHGQGPQSERHRPRRHQTPARTRQERFPQAPLASVAGRRIHRPGGQRRRLGGEGLGMDRRDRAPP
jgi:transposase